MANYQHFDKIISLGVSCQVAHQIRRLRPLQQEAYFFDWLITPHRGLMEALALLDSRKVRLEKERLTEKTIDGKINCIVDSASLIEYHHDFKIEENWLDSFDQAANKYDALAQRWYGIVNSYLSILFIRHEALGDISDIEVEEIQAFFAKTYKKLNYYILVLHRNFGDLPKCEGPRRKRIEFQQPEPWVWSGGDKEWDALALEYGI